MLSRLGLAFADVSDDVTNILKTLRYDDCRCCCFIVVHDVVIVVSAAVVVAVVVVITLVVYDKMFHFCFVGTNYSFY